MRERKGLPQIKIYYHNVREICEEKGLPIPTFNNHKMVETEEGKGLPRVAFNYHLFCRNVGRKRAVSSHLCYHKIVRI